MAEGKKEEESENKLSVSALCTANTVAAGDVMHGTSNRPTAQLDALLIDKRQKAAMERRGPFILSRKNVASIAERKRHRPFFY